MDSAQLQRFITSLCGDGVTEELHMHALFMLIHEYSRYRGLLSCICGMKGQHLDTRAGGQACCHSPLGQYGPSRKSQCCEYNCQYKSNHEFCSIRKFGPFNVFTNLTNPCSSLWLAPIVGQERHLQSHFFLSGCEDAQRSHFNQQLTVPWCSTWV